MSSVQVKGFATTCLCSLVHELLSFPRAQMAAKHAREIVLFQTSTTFTIPRKCLASSPADSVFVNQARGRNVIGSLPAGSTSVGKRLLPSVPVLNKHDWPSREQEVFPLSLWQAPVL